MHAHTGDLREAHVENLKPYKSELQEKTNFSPKPNPQQEQWALRRLNQAIKSALRHTYKAKIGPTIEHAMQTPTTLDIIH